VPVLAASGELSEQALPWGMVRQLARRADTDQGAGLTLPAGPAASADPLLVGEELMALIAARSARGVLAVVIEDLQWGWPWGRGGAQIRLIWIKGLPNRRC
jgi:hypothetical protein